jgi:hypothetical protein
MMIYPTYRMDNSVANCWSFRCRSAVSPLERAALVTIHCEQHVKNAREGRTQHYSCQSGSSQCDRNQTPSCEVTHIIEDVDNNQDRHAQVQFP